jgi:exopolysaccharide biosynthesis polyprenyl glycosylphosphotransferase
MNTIERSALNEGLALYDEMTQTVDERTLEIIERRRRTAVVRRRGWLVRRALMAADVIGLLVAFVLAELIVGPGEKIDMSNEVIAFLVTLPGWLLGAKLYGLYDHDEERTNHSTVDEFVGVFHLVTVGTWIFFIGSWLTSLAAPSLLKLVVFWGLGVGTISIGRATARAFCRHRIAYLQNTVILGAGEVGQLVGRKLMQHPEYGINLVGFVDAAPKERREDLGQMTVLGSSDRLPAIVRLFDIERVIVAFSNESHQDTLEIIRSLKDLDVQVDIVPRLFEIVGPGVGIHTVEGLPLVGLRPLRLSRSARFLKRTLDIAVSLAGLILLSPLYAYIAIRIKLDSPGPVFFRQERMGAGDKIFRIYKFRTMQSDAEERKPEYAHLNRHAKNGGDPRMFKVPGDPRVTKFGRLLRRCSLDELPQLINVFRGQMSLVGPRPLILDEDDHVVDGWARKRLDLRPGITGLWQVLGRSDIPFAEMTQLDYLYVTNWSLSTDLSLIVRTVPAVFRQSE